MLGAGERAACFVDITEQRQAQEHVLRAEKKAFLAGRPIGEAVWSARLELLAQANPLGLVYIPFAVPSLRLERAAAPPTPPAPLPDPGGPTP